MRVLVVNDEPDLLELCKFVLEDEGHTVEVTTSGHDVIALVHRFKPDVVLLDWVIPDVPGDVVLRRLRANGAVVPIVMMSASHRADEASRRLGADAFLPKPFTDEELLNTLTPLGRAAREARPGER